MWLYVVPKKKSTRLDEYTIDNNKVTYAWNTQWIIEPVSHLLFIMTFVYRYICLKSFLKKKTALINNDRWMEIQYVV